MTYGQRLKLLSSLVAGKASELFKNISHGTNTVVPPTNVKVCEGIKYLPNNVGSNIEEETHTANLVLENFSCDIEHNEVSADISNTDVELYF